MTELPEPPWRVLARADGYGDPMWFTWWPLNSRVPSGYVRRVQENAHATNRPER